LICLFGVGPGSLDDPQLPLGDTIEEQTLQSLENADRLLGKAGLGLQDVQGIRISLVDLPRFYERMDKSYRSFFSDVRAPERSCVGVNSLVRGALVELDIFARGR
jgi:2-iminobutanoate/2-iminopropanoate deaminase